MNCRFLIFTIGLVFFSTAMSGPRPAHGAAPEGTPASPLLSAHSHEKLMLE
jgi:hypothetical protein